MVLDDFLCPTHGRFESFVEWNVELVACPTCGEPSPWSPETAPAFKAQHAYAGSTMKSDAHQVEGIMNTRAIAEGQPVREWKKERAEYWRVRDEKKWRAKL